MTGIGSPLQSLSMMFFKTIFYLLPLCLFVTVSGCQEAERSPEKQTPEGLTLRELRDPDQKTHPVNAIVSVLAYQIPAGEASVLADALRILNSRVIQYEDEKGFEANNLYTGKGTPDQLNQIIREITGLNGGYVGKQDFLIFDQTEEMLAGYPVEYGQSLSYHRADRSLYFRTVPEGTFQWNFRLSDSKADLNSILIEFECVYHSAFSSRLMKAGQAGGPDDLYVPEAGLKTTLQENEFLVFTVKGPLNQTNALHRFFHNPLVEEPHVMLYFFFYHSAGNP